MTNGTAVYGLLVTNGTAVDRLVTSRTADDGLVTSGTAVDRLVKNGTAVDGLGTSGTVMDLLVTHYSRCGHVEPYTRLGGQVRAKLLNHDVT